jgi:tight adherence protein B
VTIGGLGWALRRRRRFLDRRPEARPGLGRRPANAKNAGRKAAANTPEARRKQIVEQLKEPERKERKARMSMAAKLKQAGLTMNVRTFWIISARAGRLRPPAAAAVRRQYLHRPGRRRDLRLGLPRWVVGFIGKGRMKKFSSEFANAVDVIVRGIKSGLPVHDCFKIIARESPAPLGPSSRSWSRAWAWA